MLRAACLLPNRVCIAQSDFTHLCHSCRALLALLCWLRVHCVTDATNINRTLTLEPLISCLVCISGNAQNYQNQRRDSQTYETGKERRVILFQQSNCILIITYLSGNCNRTSTCIRLLANNDGKQEPTARRQLAWLS